MNVSREPEARAQVPTFDALALGPDVRKALNELGYEHPTPVQLAVFEPASGGKNLVVQARTGTGKTAAFGLPIVDALVRKSLAEPQALVLTPTRELALQVSAEIGKIARYKGIKVLPIYGGAPMGAQIEGIKDGAQVIVGTPGRVLDHLRRGTLDPKSVRIFVLDEADEMLSMGFAKELNAIIETLPKDRQGLYFSATIPPDIERLAQAHLRDPEWIALSSDQVGALEIKHFTYVVAGGDKRDTLLRVLDVEDPESAIVFCNTKDETERLAEALQNRGFDAASLNGDMDQREREKVMTRTREGKLRFLVATDVAARGIDVSHVTHVINYDFPESTESYVHRTGRTGRAGRTGTAISLVGPKDLGNLYLLRLTYKIRPIERSLPSTGELRTREETDLVNVFLEAFSGDPSQEDLGLARRLLTHERAEAVIASLLRGYLGAKGGDPRVAAGEARRAKNPPPVVVAAPAAPAAPVPSMAKPPAPFVSASPRAESSPSPLASTVERRFNTEPMPAGKPASSRGTLDGTASSGATSPLAREERARDGRTSGREVRDDRGPRRDTRDDRGPRRDARDDRGPREDRTISTAKSPDLPRARPHSEFASWEPPPEKDDDQPILPEGAAPREVRVETRDARSTGSLGSAGSRDERGSRDTRPARDERRPRRPSFRNPNDPPDTLPFGLPEPVMPGITISDAVTPASAAKGPEKDVEDDPSFAQLFLNVGRRDGLRPGDVQKLLVDLARIDEGEHGRIRMRERITFVSVRPELLERAITALGGQVVAGRTLVAERAKPRSEGERERD
jgi:ATP-dependent RNA helicase DeaD